MSSKADASTTEPSRTEPLTERGRATKRALLNAAEAVFAEHGFDGASVAEIARRAGVAQGTFYIHFTDKKAAFLELVRKVNHDVRATGAKAIDGLDDRIDMERAGFTAFFEYVMEDPALYRIIRQAEFVDEDEYREHYRSLARPYTDGLRAAMESGQIADDVDPELLAYFLMGIGEFMGMRLVLWEHRIPPEEVFEQLMTLIKRAMAGPGLDPEEAS